MQNFGEWKEFAQLWKRNAYKRRRSPEISGDLGNFCPTGRTAPGSLSSRAELKLSAHPAEQHPGRTDKTRAQQKQRIGLRSARDSQGKIQSLEIRTGLIHVESSPDHVPKYRRNKTMHSMGQTADSVESTA
jgi:hypothetical protein